MTIAYEQVQGNGDFAKTHAAAPGAKKTRCGLPVPGTWAVGGDFQQVRFDRCVKCHQAVEKEISEALAPRVSEVIDAAWKAMYGLTEAERQVFWREVMRRIDNSGMDTKWWNQ